MGRRGQGKNSKGFQRKMNKNSKASQHTVHSVEPSGDQFFAVMTTNNGGSCDCTAADGTIYQCKMPKKRGGGTVNVGQLMAIEESSLTRGTTKAGTKKQGVICISYDKAEFDQFYKQKKVPWNPETGKIDETDDVYDNHVAEDGTNYDELAKKALAEADLKEEEEEKEGKPATGVVDNGDVEELNIDLNDLNLDDL